jgi:hypothetical protein
LDRKELEEEDKVKILFQAMTKDQVMVRHVGDNFSVITRAISEADIIQAIVGLHRGNKYSGK